MVGVLQAAGLPDTLANKEAAFTILAPTDSAFGIIPQDDLDELLANKEALTEVRFQLLSSPLYLSPFNYFPISATLWCSCGGCPCTARSAVLLHAATRFCTAHKLLMWQHHVATTLLSRLFSIEHRLVLTNLVFWGYSLGIR